MVPDAEQLWQEFFQNPDAATRQKLVLQYDYLVRYVVRGICSHNNVLEVQDLLAYGRIGLLEAIDRYDRDKNVSFKSFAIHRIRGAILDGVRAVEWAPRSIQELTKKCLRAISELERELNRPPAEEEIAERMEIPLREYRKFLDTINARRIVSLQDLLNVEIIDPDSGDRFNEDRQPYRTDLRQRLKSALRRLPAKERLVLTLYFYEGLNLNEIASVLSVTESRVSQMRSQALLRLRETLMTEVLETV